MGAKRDREDQKMGQEREERLGKNTHRGKQQEDRQTREREAKIHRKRERRTENRVRKIKLVENRHMEKEQDRQTWEIW